MQTRERGRERETCLCPFQTWFLSHHEGTTGHVHEVTQPLACSLCVTTYLVTRESTQEVLLVFLEAISTQRWLAIIRPVHRSDCKPHDHKPKVSGSWFTFYPHHQCLWSCHFRTRKSGARGGVRIQERVRERPHLVCVNALEPVITPDWHTRHYTVKLPGERGAGGTLRTYLGPKDEALALSFRKEVSYDSQPSLLQTGLRCSVVGA